MKEMKVGLAAKRGAEQYATGRADSNTTSAPRIIGAVTKKRRISISIIPLAHAQARKRVMVVRCV